MSIWPNCIEEIYVVKQLLEITHQISLDCMRAKTATVKIDNCPLE